MPTKMSLLDKIVRKMDTAYDKMNKYHKQGKAKLTEKWYKEYSRLWDTFKKNRPKGDSWSTYNRWWDKTRYIPLSKRRKKSK